MLIGTLNQDVEFKAATSKEAAQLILSPSPSHTPRPTILYRTLPRYTTQSDYAYRAKRDGSDKSMLPEDRAVRPDLQLARSDAGVKKVVEYARWFARWVGGEGPP